MLKGQLVLYYFDTVVDRLNINIVSLAGLDLKIEAYKKWKKVEEDIFYSIIVYADNSTNKRTKSGRSLRNGRNGILNKAGDRRKISIRTTGYVRGNKLFNREKFKQVGL